MTIKAIETQYKGYRFRSRLEARWAVFFDEMGLDWAYEPQGFDLGCLGWYLPDFAISGSGSEKSTIPSESTIKSARAHFFVEVKGREPNIEEARKLSLVCESFTCYGGLVYGDIPESWGKLTCLSIHKEGSFGSLDTLDGYLDLRDCVEDFWGWLRDCSGYPYDNDGHYFENVDYSLTIARSARFEHGETPK